LCFSLWQYQFCLIPISYIEDRRFFLKQAVVECFGIFLWNSLMKP
jgi:hypothetical protein